MSSSIPALHQQVSLFDPIEIRTVRARNRIWVPALCQYTVVARDGLSTDWHLVHLGSFARGGAGLIVAEATAVLPEGRISPHDTGIWDEAHVAAWRRVTDFVHTQGAVVGLQLAHAGRKASVYPEWGGFPTGAMPPSDGGWPTVSASDAAFGDYPAPRALTVDDIRGVVDAFRVGARRAIDAGFDLVEIHAAHGYLIHQFLSPLSNGRQDDYGGPLENRARFLLEITRAVRTELGPDVPVFIRFSATDYVEGGWDQDQTATVAAWCREAGADLFDISSGGLLAGVRVPFGPGYQVPFAQYVRTQAGVPVSAVGLITDAHQAAAIVQSGQADAVMLGRETMRDPHFSLHAATILGVELDYWPPQYLRARPV